MCHQISSNMDDYSEDRINELYLQTLDQLLINPHAKEQLLQTQSKEKKWQMIQMHVSLILNRLCRVSASFWYRFCHQKTSLTDTSSTGASYWTDQHTTLLNIIRFAVCLNNLQRAEKCSLSAGTLEFRTLVPLSGFDPCSAQPTGTL
jgi:hypothetical protein